MNIHLNLNQMGNMIYKDPTRIEEEEEEDIVQGVSRTFSEEEESSCSLSSMCSSSDLTEDDDDDDDDVSSSSSNGPLEDLSDLMSHLPIKKGLSKFYEGRSQSFTSLANVKSLEDLMKRGFKKNRNYGARRKACRNSTGGILDQSYKRVYSPKPTISKKPNKTPSSTLSCLARKRH